MRTLQCSQRFLIELCTFIPRVWCCRAVTAWGLATGLATTDRPHFDAVLEGRDKERAWRTSVCGRRGRGIAVVGRDADEDR